jgi:DNA-binding MarR family transcriptional regulator
MTKKITRRQHQFLSQFLDMYQEIDKPIHYVALAKRLDIGKVTAYEMLRLLEKRGLVKSEFHLPPGDRGPGRSTVLFRPTQKTIQLVNEISDGTVDSEDWESAKSRILQKLHEGKVESVEGYESLLNDLLVRISKRRSPLIFMTEMITATILTVASIQKTAEDKGLIDRLQRIGLPGEIGLSALAGISSALSLVENVNLSLSTFLLNHSVKYQEMLTQLSEEKRNQLSDFAREVTKIVRG